MQAKTFSMLMLLPVLAAILISGCSDNPTGLDISDKEAVPLARANYWIYNSYRSVGDVEKNYLDTMKVLRDTIINEKRWYITNNSDSAGKIVSLVGNSKQGYETARPVSGGLDITLLFKYPCEEGEKFPFLSDSMAVVTKDTIINTQAGSFSCIRYDYKTTSPFSDTTQVNIIHFYVEPGTGLVLSESWYWEKISSPPQLLASNELIEYDADNPK